MNTRPLFVSIYPPEETPTLRYADPRVAHVIDNRRPDAFPAPAQRHGLTGLDGERNNFMTDSIAPRIDHSALDACHELEYLLLGDLRELLGDPETPQTRRSLLLILDHLLANLPRQLELKCQGGYMSEVLAEHPAWQNEVDELLRDDRDCNSALARMHQRVRQDLSWRPIAHEMRDTLDVWMGLLNAIRKHEIRMLQTAFILDLGGEA